MTRRSKKTCAAAITALSAAAIIVAAPVQAQITGFGDGSGYTLNSTSTTPGVPASISGGTLTLTTPANNDTNTAWNNTKQNIQGFNAAFTFSYTGSSTPYNADGFSFTLQNDSINAIGGGGGQIAYAGVNGTNPSLGHSYAVGFDGFNDTSTTDISIEQGVKGGLQTPIDTGLMYANGPINITVGYDGANVNVNMVQGASSFTQSFAANIPYFTGSATAYVGFTGATGGYNMGQQISDFTFTSVPATATATIPPAGYYNISSPSDVVTPIDNDGGSNPANEPAAEQVTNITDSNYGTKYLNFTGNMPGGAGFTDTPAVGSSIVQGFGITSANDSPDRDPTSYTLYGSNDGTFSVTSPVISQGTISLFTSRDQTQYLTFANSTAYTSYELIFPTVANNAVDANGNPVAANSMQVAEVALLAAAPEPGAPVALILGSLGLLGMVARRRKMTA